MPSAPSYSSIEPRMQAHLDALRFHSVGSYRIWCHKQGLDAGLTKTEAQLTEEAALFRCLQAKAPAPPTKGHRPGTARSITKAYESRHRVWVGLDALFDGAKDQAERDALHGLLLHLEKYTRVPFEVGARLARHHRSWLRPPEDWYPRSRKEPLQVGELANHLLAPYATPLFMGRAWLDGGQTAERYQGWFLHMARGGSIRGLDCDIRLTRRMAHVFRQAPVNLTIPMVLRWAQCVGMGGSRPLAHAVVRSRLRQPMADEPFWETVVRFLVNHAMLEPTQVGPIVDYVHNQRFVPRETDGPAGEVIREPPAQPDLAMKGRSIGKLLREVEAWHCELAREKTVRWVEWPACGISDFAFEERDEASGAPLGWRIVELRNSHDLTGEGSVMHHCVYSYRDRCASGDLAVFSVQVKVGGESPQQVLSIAVDIGERVVTEFRGKYNLRPNQKKRPPKKGDLQPDYLRLLDRSEKIMDRWMAEKGLKSS